MTPKPGVPFTLLGLSPTLWLIVFGGVLLALFARREAAVKARGDEPLLDLALLGIPMMRAGLAVQSIQAFIIQASFFVLPLYLQTVLGFDALQTGKTILPLSVALFLFALGGSALTGRFSPKLIVQRGLAALLVGELVILYFIAPDLQTWASASAWPCSEQVSDCWRRRWATSSCRLSIRRAAVKPAASRARR